MEVYQYVTWVDDPGIPGDQNYKRVTVVVRYNAPAANSVNQFVRASTLISPGTVTITPSATTSTTAASSTTTIPSTTTTTAASSCPGDTTAPAGTVTIGAAGAADAGYTASANVSLNMSFTDTCTPIVANFSNDNVTWGADVVYTSSSPQISWPLSAGNGAKTIYSRVRDGIGNSATLAPLDRDPRRDCADEARRWFAHALVLRQAAHDRHLVDGVERRRGNLRGYRIYRSTDAVNWTAVGTTSAPDVLRSALEERDDDDVQGRRLRQGGQRVGVGADAAHQPREEPVQLMVADPPDTDRDEAGFSIIELIVVTVLLTIVIVVTFSTLWSMQRSEASREVVRRRWTTCASPSTGSQGPAAGHDSTRPRHRATSTSTPTSTVRPRVVYDVTGGMITRQLNGGDAVVMHKELTEDAIFQYPEADRDARHRPDPARRQAVEPAGYPDDAELRNRAQEPVITMRTEQQHEFTDRKEAGTGR